MGTYLSISQMYAFYPSPLMHHEVIDYRDSLILATLETMRRSQFSQTIIARYFRIVINVNKDTRENVIKLSDGQTLN